MMTPTARVFATVAMGLVLGSAQPARAQYHFTSIDVPGATRTNANGNSSHAIVGEFDDANQQTHGFVLCEGEYTRVDVPGATWTEIYGINVRGEIVGAFQDASGVVHGFVGTRGW